MLLPDLIYFRLGSFIPEGQRQVERSLSVSHGMVKQTTSSTYNGMFWVFKVPANKTYKVVCELTKRREVEEVPFFESFDARSCTYKRFDMQHRYNRSQEEGFAVEEEFRNTEEVYHFNEDGSLPESASRPI